MRIYGGGISGVAIVLGLKGVTVPDLLLFCAFLLFHSCPFVHILISMPSTLPTPKLQAIIEGKHLATRSAE
jgi:hypothetical protein